MKAVDRIVLNDRDICQSMANYWVIYLQHWGINASASALIASVERGLLQVPHRWQVWMID
ncbi:hypothetical protein SynBIOSE41_02497 [Synechococcus sp. BIOS-E4-1]|nr:hypothetical protein SynBIOSE41_02497 [Synechococcus sp. BIOS-E4-1]